MRVDDGLTAAATGETDVVRSSFQNLIISKTDIVFRKDEIRFMRIRTKKHEILISPGEYRQINWTYDNPNTILSDDRYLLAVLQDPAAWP